MSEEHEILSKLSSLEEQGKQRQNQLDRIEKGLFGDEEFDQDGLIETVGKNTQHRRRIEKGLMIAAGAGVTSPWWMEMKKWIVNHIL